MKHAYQILREEKYMLEGLIRRIRMNEHEILQPLDSSQEEQWLVDIDTALLRLKTLEDQQ